MKSNDTKFLKAAIRFARKNQGLTGTNPSVACLIVAETIHGSTIVGRGVTAYGGRPHAEPIALEQAGEKAKGATAYVTLEPCAHHGSTPPCAQTLIDAGVSRVVTAMVDPDVRVNGKGHQMLVDEGIEVCEIDVGEISSRSIEGYLKNRDCNRPFVTLKLAMTHEGIIGLKSGERLKITGAISNSQVHLIRARHDCILVGSGTIIADDPQLTCRLSGLEGRSPERIILDSSNQLNQGFAVVQTSHEVPTMIVAPASPDLSELCKASPVEHLACEMFEGKIALPELLDDLGAKGIQSLMVEGGGAVASAFIEAELVDEIVLFVGNDAQSISNADKVVYASFNPGNLPEKFEIREEMMFGTDRCLRLRQSVV